MANILVTGASGFIGSFIVQEAINKGFNVWAGIRSTSSRKYLQDPSINFIELNFADVDQLKEQLVSHVDKQGKFDYIIHCAGVTKCLHSSDFDEVNYHQTKRFINLLIELSFVPKQFLYISTLSVFGPIHEATFSTIKEGDKRLPNTRYGISKLKLEFYLESLSDFPYVIFRPTGVYGPREMDYFLMAKSVKKHLDFAVGFSRQDLTFIYVKDLVQALFCAIDKNVVKKAYNLSDGNVYSSRAFSDLIQKELGVSFLIRIKCPFFILKIISLLAHFWGSCFNKSTTLNKDKYKIMKQRNWRCDINLAKEEFGYSPNYDLEKGVKETIAWYKKEKWL